MAASTAKKEADGDYILGSDRQELERLRFQHHAWIQQGYALFERAGLRTGQVVLDLGCGPGFTSFELARVVGLTGRVIARDQNRRFLDHLAAERERLGLAQIEPSLGPVEELELPPEQLDAAYARWLFCWLAEPEKVLQLVTRALRRGGVILLQEYLDWGAMKLMPRSAAFERVVAGCLSSWREGGATIDLAEHVPALAAACGLQVEHFRPIARLGRVGSLEWRWLTEFFGGYLPKLVERGLLTAEDLQRYHDDWARRTAEGTSYCMTPTMADVVLRKP